MNKLHERLKRLRDRLEDMEGKWKPFGFGILRRRPQPRSRSQRGNLPRMRANRILANGMAYTDRDVGSI